MADNKPDVVAWRWRKPIVNDQGETIGTTAWELGDTPEFLTWWTNDPLIRISDYEALKAENEALRDQVTKLSEALQVAQQGSVPDGWKLVPVEPTTEMRYAYHEADQRYLEGSIPSPDGQWWAMLDAAPQPEQEAEGWIKCSERLPTEACEALLDLGGKVVNGAWIAESFWYSNAKVSPVAWMHHPKPISGGSND